MAQVQSQNDPWFRFATVAGIANQLPLWLDRFLDETTCVRQGVSRLSNAIRGSAGNCKGIQNNSNESEDEVKREKKMTRAAF